MRGPALHCTALHCTALATALHCTALHHSRLKVLVCSFSPCHKKYPGFYGEMCDLSATERLSSQYDYMGDKIIFKTNERVTCHSGALRAMVLYRMI